MSQNVIRAMRSAISGPSLRTAVTGYAVLGANVITGVLSARLLLVEGRGALAIVQMWPTLAAYLMDLGITAALMFYSAKSRSKWVIYRFGLRSVILVTAGGYSLGFVGLWILSRSHGDLVALTFAMLLLFIPLNATARMTQAALQGLQRYSEMNAGRMIASVSTLFVLPPLFLASVNLRLLGSLTAICVGQISQIVWNIHRLVRLEWASGNASHTDGQSKNPLRFRDLVKYGLKAHLGGLSPVDGVHIDMQVVAAFLSKYDAGIYAVATSIGGLVRNLGASFGVVAGSRAAGSNRIMVRSEVFRSMVRAGVLSLAASIGLGFLVVPWALPLAYGHGFEAAVPYAQVMLGIGAIGGLRQLGADLLRGLNAPGKASLAELVSLLSAAALLPLGARLYGLTGVLVGVLLAYVVSLVVQSISLYRTLGA